MRNLSPLTNSSHWSHRTELMVVTEDDKTLSIFWHFVSSMLKEAHLNVGYDTLTEDDN